MRIAMTADVFDAQLESAKVIAHFLGAFPVLIQSELGTFKCDEGINP